MPLYGKVQAIDPCIHQIIAALNAGGVRTVASCCGHKTMNGMITLEDGRVLVIFPETPKNMDEWKSLIIRSPGGGPQ